ncbi:MAG: DUF4352 domain-containing protein [Dehalococcoidia bacterium]|jgi:hypothetical protein
MKILSLWVALGLAALLFIACSSNSQKTESTAQPTRTGQPTSSVNPVTAAPTAGLTAAPIEQSAPPSQKQIGDLLVTVNGASLYTDDSFPAAPGTYYVAVDITTKNTGDQDYLLNILDFHLKDSDGNTHDPAMTKGPEPQIGSYDNIVPGQVERGFIVFPLGDGSDPAELDYASSSGNTGTIPVPKPSP